MRFLLLSLLFFTSVSSFAQKDSLQSTAPEVKGFDKHKMFVGGRLGLNFGDNTLILVAPNIGYMLHKNFAVGVGLQYIYMSNPSFSANIWGGSMFARYFPFKQVFGHIELEHLGIEGPDRFINQTRTYYSTATLAGLGYAYDLGGISYFSVSLLWNLTPDIYTPYITSPIIRTGISIGL